MQKPGSLLKGGRRALCTISGSTFRRKQKIRTLLLLEKRFGFFLFGGPGGIRTLDLSNRTLSQLSYRPICKAGRPVFSMTNVLRPPYYTAFWRDCQADFSGFLQMFCARLPLPAFGRAQSRRVSVCWHGGSALLCVSEKIRGDRLLGEFRFYCSTMRIRAVPPSR